MTFAGGLPETGLVSRALGESLLKRPASSASLKRAHYSIECELHCLCLRISSSGAVQLEAFGRRQSMGHLACEIALEKFSVTGNPLYAHSPIFMA